MDGDRATAKPAPSWLFKLGATLVLLALAVFGACACWPGPRLPSARSRARRRPPSTARCTAIAAARRASHPALTPAAAPLAWPASCRRRGGRAGRWAAADGGAAWPGPRAGAPTAARAASGAAGAGARAARAANTRPARAVAAGLLHICAGCQQGAGAAGGGAALQHLGPRVLAARAAGARAGRATPHAALRGPARLGLLAGQGGWTLLRLAWPAPAQLRVRRPDGQVALAGRAPGCKYRPPFTPQAIRGSRHAAPDLDSADLVFVDAHCYLIRRTARLNGARRAAAASEGARAWALPWRSAV